METSEEILKERERIKALILKQKEAVEVLCSRKAHRRHSLAKAKILRLFDNALFWLYHPDYVRIKDRI